MGPPLQGSRTRLRHEVGERPDLDAPLAPAHGDLVEVDEVDRLPAEPGLRRLGDEEHLAGVLRRGLDTRGRVDDIADRGVLEAPFGTDVAGDDRAAVQPDSDPEPLPELHLLDPAVEARK